jgi:hypothetical protein
MGNLAAEQATPATLNPTVRTREYLTQREIDRQHAGSIRESFRFGATGRGRKRRIQYGDCALARSALGHKRTCAVHQPMSALPPIATAKADSRKRPYGRFCVKPWRGDHAERSVGGPRYGAGALTSSLLFLRCP